jgi:Domain of unknown function (DUF4351)
MLNIQDVRLEDTCVYQDIQEEVRVKDRQELILRLLTNRLGNLPEPLKARISAMSLDQLEALFEVFFNFHEIAELDSWLAQNL